MMVNIEKLNRSNVEVVNNIMEEYDTNCISLVNHCPVLLLNLNEFAVTKIIKADTIYFKCVNVLDATNVCIVEMADTIIRGSFDSLLNAIIVHKSAINLIEEEKTLRKKIRKQFELLLQTNENCIVSENDFCVINKYCLYGKEQETFNFNLVRISDLKVIMFFDKKTNCFVVLSSLPTKDQIKLYEYFRFVVEQQLFDKETNCMIDHC